MMTMRIMITLSCPEGHQDIYGELDVVNWSFIIGILIIYMIGN